MYEVVIPEPLFEKKRDSQELKRALASPSVEGIYETQAPLLLRALMAMGCVSQVGDQRRQRAMAGDARASSSEFNLADLEWLSTTTHTYLQPDSATFKCVCGGVLLACPVYYY